MIVPYYYCYLFFIKEKEHSRERSQMVQNEAQKVVAQNSYRIYIYNIYIYMCEVRKAI